ncbi:Pentatricopeptide repeat-containing protein [Ananas comosus]|nr:Pentatricopeptide repeat-containing protein [Ananas comosus]
MLVRGFLSDSFALRELIFSSAVSVPGAFSYAHQLFSHIPRPNLFMWNSIIRGAAHSAAPSDALSLYTRMARSGARPNKLTFPFLLRACAKLSAPSAGAQFHAAIVKSGLDSDPFVRNALINFHACCGDAASAHALFDERARGDAVAWSAMVAGYAKKGDLGVARELFDESPAKDLVSYNVMITAYAKRGEMESAQELFDTMPQRDVVTWNAIISGYVRCGSHARAVEVFGGMRERGESPDDVTMLSLLSTCADSGALDVGRRLHYLISDMCSRNGLSIVLGNALIDMYAKCGSIGGALEVFGGMREKDISTWNSIIRGLAFHGHSKEALQLFDEMLNKRLRPDEITFVGVLVACSHGGMVDEGQRYFLLMQNEYRIEPNIRHYGCMVDILGRAGLLKEAFKFVGEMKVEPNAIVWRTLLGACRVHGDVELGKRANEELMKVQSEESGDYVLLSNIYASVGEWDGSEKVRKLMDDSGVCKEAGCTLIEAGGKESKQLSLPFSSSCRLKEAVH